MPTESWPVAEAPNNKGPFFKCVCGEDRFVNLSRFTEDGHPQSKYNHSDVSIACFKCRRTYQLGVGRVKDPNGPGLIKKYYWYSASPQPTVTPPPILPSEQDPGKEGGPAPRRA